MFSFLSVETTPYLTGFLSGLLRENRIPSLYAYIGDRYDHSDMPSKFKTLNYNHPSFLDIAGHILTGWLTIILVVGILLLTVCLSSNPIVIWLGVYSKQLIWYNGIIRIVLSSIVYLMFGIALNFRYGINFSIISLVNTSISVIVL